mmetsp:Transcript_59817/g.177289  ORF Transcript_59817/g.177289 Transcript_59817/m.177289 type:complete len:203 (-) Transcript_59817:645-1253(-)
MVGGGSYLIRLTDSLCPPESWPRELSEVPLTVPQPATSEQSLAFAPDDDAVELKLFLFDAVPPDPDFGVSAFLSISPVYILPSTASPPSSNTLYARFRSDPTSMACFGSVPRSFPPPSSPSRIPASCALRKFFGSAPNPSGESLHSLNLFDFIHRPPFWSPCTMYRGRRDDGFPPSSDGTTPPYGCTNTFGSTLRSSSARSL